MTAAIPAIPKPKRRWFQFSLRTLLVLILVCGAGFGWFGSKVKWEREQREISKVLNTERQELERQYEIKHQELLRAMKAVQEPGGVEETGGVPSWAQRLQEMDKALAAVRKDRLQAQAVLTALQTALTNASASRPLLVAINPGVAQAVLAKARSGDSAKFRDNPAEHRLVAERAKLEAVLTQLGEDHPLVAEKLAAVRDAEEAMNGSVPYQKFVDDQLVELMDESRWPMLITSLEERLRTLSNYEKLYGLQLQLVVSEDSRRRDNEAALKRVEGELGRLRRLHDTLIGRIANIDIARDKCCPFCRAAFLLSGDWW